MAYTNIDDPSAHFQTAPLWSGQASQLVITNDGNSDLQPDFVWIKCRNASQPFALVDSTRGTSKYLSCASTAAEATDTGRLTSFNTDGFTLGGGSGPVNTGGGNYVGWQWKANSGTTSTNTDGDINSTVQVNSDAGFSIVQYNPSNATARSIGHGLGVQPQVVIVRARDRVENWRVFHRGAGTTGSLMLDSDAAYNSNTVLFAADSTSTVFKVGTDFSVNGAYNYIAYCFAEKQGYSKFGYYTGNGTAGDGPFVYTGFKPAFVILKTTDIALDWFVYDHKRPGSGNFNEIKSVLYANATSGGSGASYRGIDFLSNGFKLRNGGNGGPNQSAQKYIYMAFAEEPFVTSTGVPATAR